MFLGGSPDYTARVNQHGYPYVLVSLLRVHKRLSILNPGNAKFELPSAKDLTVVVVRRNNHKNMKISSTERGKFCKNRLGL